MAKANGSDRNTLLFGAALLAAGAAIAADHANHMRKVAAAPAVSSTAAPGAGARCATSPCAAAPCAAAPCAASPCAAAPAATQAPARGGTGVLITTPPAEQY
jgi:hypothetical protein